MDLFILCIILFIIYKILARRHPKTYSDKKGYLRFTYSGKPVHRWAAEKKLGRKLRFGEVVHHKNRNKSDNRFSNLWIFPSQWAHFMTHRKDERRHGKKASYKGF